MHLQLRKPPIMSLVLQSWFSASWYRNYSLSYPKYLYTKDFLQSLSFCRQFVKLFYCILWTLNEIIFLLFFHWPRIICSQVFGVNTNIEESAASVQVPSRRPVELNFSPEEGGTNSWNRFSDFIFSKHRCLFKVTYAYLFNKLGNAFLFL